MADVADRLQAALADRYRIQGELGRGGMATVYLAEDLKHHRQVALKVLRPDLAASIGPGRFLREIEIAARLQHPNILAVYDSGEAAGFLYYVMPFVEGGSLRERLSEQGELAVGEAVRILRDVADALAHAHGHGVLHRDIKPANILLSGRHALVADFGVAKAVSEAAAGETLTTVGVALGTPTYMAPEQAVADPQMDQRADIYAFGATAYELLAGRPPFEGASAAAVFAAHLTEAPVPLLELRPQLPPVLAGLVMRCLAKQPADREQTAEELLQVLEVLATPSGGVTRAYTQPVRKRVRRGPRRRVLVAIGVTVAAVAAGTTAIRVLVPRSVAIKVTDIAAVTTDYGVEYLPAISPDGRDVAYTVGPILAPRLAIKSTANVVGGGEVRLADPALQVQRLPAWSTDGDLLRFTGCLQQRMDFTALLLWGGCSWQEMGKLGGVPRPAVLPPGARSTYAAWSADGSRVAFVRGDTIFGAVADDTVVRPVAVHSSGNAGLHSLAWSPDGRWIAYVNGNAQWLVNGNDLASSIC